MGIIARIERHALKMVHAVAKAGDLNLRVLNLSPAAAFDNLADKMDSPGTGTTLRLGCRGEYHPDSQQTNGTYCLHILTPHPVSKIDISMAADAHFTLSKQCDSPLTIPTRIFLRHPMFVVFRAICA